METKIEIYIPGETRPESTEVLIGAVKDIDPDKSYANMIRYRIDGNAADQCKDVYYICTDENGKFCSRLWMGWGRHKGAVGNWGNFNTDESLRGQGIGRIMMDAWTKDLANRDDAPLALFCTASERHTAWYKNYGWRCAMKDAVRGPLYFPIGNSPETFGEFCEMYYKPASSLTFKPATVEWRHEIDCLFKFAMLYIDQDYLPCGMESLEVSLLAGDKNVEIIFTDTNIPVGLSYKKPDGTKDIKIYPAYVHLL